MIKIPGFGANTVRPTPDLLYALRQFGIVQPAISAFADVNHFKEAVNDNVPPPINGQPPKYWADTNHVKAAAYMMLSAGFNGYKVKKAGQMTTDENLMYSMSARAFYTERPELLVPEVRLIPMDPEESARLSFAPEIEDPVDYPLAMVWRYGADANGNIGMDCTWPKEAVLFMYDGVACGAMLGEAMKLFPLVPQMPTGAGAGTGTGGMTDAQVIKLATSLAVSSAVRAAAFNILNGVGTDAQKVKNLTIL